MPDVAKANVRAQGVAYWMIKLLKQPNDHGCGGGFAVSAGDGYKFKPFIFEDFVNKLVALGGFDAILLTEFQLGMISRQGRAVNEPINRFVFMNLGYLFFILVNVDVGNSLTC